MARPTLRGPVTDYDTPPLERAHDEVPVLRSRMLGRLAGLAIAIGVVGAVAVLLGDTLAGDLAVPVVVVLAVVLGAVAGGVWLGSGGRTERTRYW